MKMILDKGFNQTHRQKNTKTIRYMETSKYEKQLHRHRHFLYTHKNKQIHLFIHVANV